MTNPVNYFTKTIFLTTCLTLGCTSGGVMGCGSSTEPGPMIESALLGVYEVTSYQGSQTGCDPVSDITLGRPDFLVLYSFRPNDEPDVALLGGSFCRDVEECRTVAEEAPEPVVGYSFLSGGDEAGWNGWAIQSAGGANDQCRADVQAHVLTSTGNDTINVETQTFETVFPPMFEGSVATCRNADALAALDPSLPCKEIIILKGTLTSAP